jgi:PHD/YefM family antitoxin component YafN of YafNO toxin-antitoxin module
VNLCAETNVTNERARAHVLCKEVSERTDEVIIARQKKPALVIKVEVWIF